MFGLFVDSAEDLDGSPKLDSWNRVSPWHLASQEPDALQLEGCAAENLQRKGGHSDCALSQMFGSVATASRSVRGYQPSRILASVHSVSLSAGNQSSGNN